MHADKHLFGAILTREQYRCRRRLSVQIEGFPPNCRHCMWDQVDRDVLMISDARELHTYVHSHTTIRGSMVRKLAKAFDHKAVGTRGRV